MNIYICIYTYIYLYIYTYIYIYIYIYMYKCIRIYVYICLLYICVLHIYICIHMYLHIDIIGSWWMLWRSRQEEACGPGVSLAVLTAMRAFPQASFIPVLTHQPSQLDHLAKNRVWSLGFGIWGLGFGVWGLGCALTVPAAEHLRETTRKVVIRLPGKGNSNSHGARPVH